MGAKPIPQIRPVRRIKMEMGKNQGNMLEAHLKNRGGDPKEINHFLIKLIIIYKYSLSCC